MSVNRFIRLAGWLGLALLTIGIAVFGVRNLGNRYFWTDESSSFFTALGWPGPGQPPGGLAEIQQGLVTFLDPGLFHLLIRGWTELFGSSIIALRSLPFIFFLAYLVGLFAWYRQFRLPLIVASAGISVMLLDNITPYYAVEVRAYSATMAAAVLLPLAALALAKEVNARRVFIFVITLMFFGSMQYMTMSVNVGAAAVLAVAALRTGVVKERALLFGTAFLSCAWLPLIYLITRGVPTTAPEAELDHVRSTVLAFMDADAVRTVLATNFLSPTALPRTIFLLAIPALAVTAISAHRCRRSVTLVLHSDTLALWTFVLVATGTAAALSLVGALPWVVGTRWSIADIAFIGLSVAGLAVLARDVSRPFRPRWVVAVVAALSVVVVFAGSARMAVYERIGDSGALEYLVPLALSGNPRQPILIDYWIYPDTRYWVEYSGLLDRYRQDWIDRGLLGTPGFQPASPEDVRAFVDSDLDRMLLRDGSPVLGPLPSGVTVVRPPLETWGDLSESQVPVLLVKELKVSD